MFSKFSKFIYFGLALIFAFQFALPALADLSPIVNPWGDPGIQNNIQTNTGLGMKDPRAIAALLINILLGFLGIIAVVLILFAGFKWMTAGGNEEDVAGAKKMLIAGVIGLIIIIAAFAIANFVLSSIQGAVTS